MTVLQNLKHNIKKKTGPKKKINAKSVRLIKRNVNNIIEYNEKVTARKVISICNLKVNRRTMQRELYGNITKRICLTKVDKISRVEICKTWLKTRVNFAKVVMTKSSFALTDLITGFLTMEKEK